MTKKSKLSSILFNYAYQVKKAAKLGKLNFSALRYFWSYVESNKKSESYHLNWELPWITFQACDFLETILKKDFIVFEFGSGGSSFFFSKRSKKVYSVEHDETWFSHIEAELKAKGYANSNLHVKLLTPSYKTSGIAAESLSDKRYSSFDFEEYANSVLDFPDHSFDLIVIDGRARPYCLRNSLPKLKPGGYLLFDNSDRVHYQEELGKIKSWFVLESYGPTIGDLSFNQTSIFRKPLA